MRIIESFMTQFKTQKKSVLRVWDGNGHKPLTQKEYRSPITSQENQRLVSAPLFSDYLNPCMDIKGRYILMKDLKTVGMLFEISPLSVEGRSPESIAELYARASKVFSDTLPEESDGHWILQFFLEDEQSLEPLLTKLISYIPKELLETEYTQSWLSDLEVHLKQVGGKESLFFDKVVSNSPWRGRMRRVRCCLWKHSNKNTMAAESDIDQVANSIINAFAQSGTTVHLLRPAELYAWLSRWFVPQLPDSEKLSTIEQYLRSRPWRSNVNPLFGDQQNDLSSAALHGVAPRSDVQGNWFFRGLPTRFVTLEASTDALPIGVLTGEQTVGNHKRVLWDSMPAGSIFSMTVIISNQDPIVEHIQRVKLNSVGDVPSVMAKRSVADEVIENMAKGERVHRLFAGVFLRGDDDNDLKSKCSQVTSLFSSYNLRSIPPSEDLLAQDSFIRALPFGYDPEHDKNGYVKRSRFWYASEIAKLAPIFGRSTGTGNPGLVFYNRGADPLTLDILSKLDRKRNSHALILGPTGSGKTSLIIYILLQMIAVHRPRIFLISALSTFSLFAAHLKRLGLSVNYIKVGEDPDISLPPFIDAQNIHRDGDALKADLNARDIMSDLELQAILMITGGDPKEEEAMRRSDRMLIRKAIQAAVDTCNSEDRQVLTEDVVKAMYGLCEDDALDEVSKRSVADKARAMELFCSGFAGALFNRPGKLWPDADVTILELGPLANQSAKDYLSVAVTSLLSKINTIAQRDQNKNRQLITVIDEAHILLKNPLIAPYLNNITAMWRTFGAWLWIATQTLAQFPQTSRELLQQPEWWICMTMNKKEVEEIARFKNLSQEEKEMLLSAQKEAGKFTEGVILSDRFNTLFRNVVPAIALALSQTEKHEKFERAQVMQAQNITEIEAVYQIADEIIKQRGAHR